MARRHRRHHLPDAPRAFNDFLIRSSLLFDGVGGLRCQAGRPLHCSRSCCARRRRTSRCRRICASWRWRRSHRPPIRTCPSPVLASTSPGLPPTSLGPPPTSPGLGSSLPTPSWIRRKCRPRQPFYCPPKGQSTNCRRKRRRRTAHQIGPSEKHTRSLTAAHHSRSVGYSHRRSRRSGAVAVTEPFQPSSCVALRPDFTDAERSVRSSWSRGSKATATRDPLNCLASYPPVGGPSYRVIHLEFDRVRGVLKGVHLFPLQFHVCLDLVHVENIALQQERVVGAQFTEGLAQ